MHHWADGRKTLIPNDLYRIKIGVGDGINVAKGRGGVLYQRRLFRLAGGSDGLEEGDTW